MFADFERIAQILEQLPDGKLAIAFSGGVDSVTLARASEIVLGKENILLLIADSVFAPSGEKNFASQWAEARKLACIKVPFAPLQDALIAQNATVSKNPIIAPVKSIKTSRTELPLPVKL